jgi:hypothetical protein
MKFQASALVLGLVACEAFQGPLSTSVSWTSPLLVSPIGTPLFASDPNKDGPRRTAKRSLLKRVFDRVDTIGSAGLKEVKVAGIGDKIKNLHGPKTYLLLALAAGLKWKWCFRNPYYWFAVAFCVKWYRARYVFKIPVWDRQPNWNNIITSKEQEKDLKAYTCLNCGSTIFIAKTREFFFEGDTGIGGLGCFSCGARGKDNFVMDRDRIVEDVADVDDYFEYERPLDFVSRAERRKLLKEAGGSEEKANELLMARSGTNTPVLTPSEGEVNRDVDSDIADAKVEETSPEESTELVAEVAPNKEPPSLPTVTPPNKQTNSTNPPPKVASPKKTKPSVDDDLDVLDMD